MLIRLLCRKMIQKETPDSPMIGGQGVEVSKTLFYSGIPEKGNRDCFGKGRAQSGKGIRVSLFCRAGK